MQDELQAAAFNPKSSRKSVGKLVAARARVGERKQVRDKEVRDERGRRELQRTLSLPLIYIIFFNWSKLIFKHFILFILLFWLCGSLAFLLYFVQSLLLVNMPLDYH